MLILLNSLNKKSATMLYNRTSQISFQFHFKFIEKKKFLEFLVQILLNRNGNDRVLVKNLIISNKYYLKYFMCLSESCQSLKVIYTSMTTKNTWILPLTVKIVKFRRCYGSGDKHECELRTIIGNFFFVVVKKIVKFFSFLHSVS